MIYKNVPKSKDKLSIISFGCMRFPTKGGKINRTESENLLNYGIENGINYYDTAMPYHNGESESFVGEYFYKTKLREKVYIATKLPVWDVRTRDDFKSIFKKQLKKLKTNYIDYYLLHALNKTTWNNVYNLGVLDFLENLKKEGIIRHIGFSFHDDFNTFKKILQSYHWDFTQIQFNYFDKYYQAGVKGLELAKSKNIGVFVMEPLRGGVLANVPVKIKKIFNSSKFKDFSSSKLSFRWIWNHDGVITALSGMEKISEVKQNIASALSIEKEPITNEEIKLIEKARNEFIKILEIPCTSCNYCMPCPKGVNIPVCFNLYNTKNVFNKTMHANIMYAQMINGVVGTYASPNLCIECGECEKQCPQKINIVDKLKLVKKSFESKKMKVFYNIIKFIIIYKKLINKLLNYIKK